MWILPSCRNAAAFDAEAQEQQAEARPQWLSQPDGAELLAALSEAAGAISRWWVAQEALQPADSATVPHSADVRYDCLLI